MNIILGEMRSGTQFLSKKIVELHDFDDWKYSVEYQKELDQAVKDHDFLLFRFHFIPVEYPHGGSRRDLQGHVSNYWHFVKGLALAADNVIIHYRQSVFDMTVSRCVWDSDVPTPMHLDLEWLTGQFKINYLFHHMFLDWWSNQLPLNKGMFSTYEELSKDPDVLIRNWGKAMGVSLTTHDIKWSARDYSKIVSNYSEVMQLKAKLEGNHE